MKSKHCSPAALFLLLPIGIATNNNAFFIAALVALTIAFSFTIQAQPK